MTITQTIDIPADRRITLEVPPEVPVGRTNVIIQFPVRGAPAIKPEDELFLPEDRALPDPLPGGNYCGYTVDEFLKEAEKKFSDPNREPISRLFGTMPNHSFGDPVAYQRAIRDEWDD